MQNNYRLWTFLWLFLVWCALSGAHYFFYRFSFHPLNPFGVTRGLTIASGMWSTVLLVAVLCHYAWARYALISWVVLALIGFGAAILMMNSQSVTISWEPTKAALMGMGLLAVTLIPLGRSAALQRYVAPRTAGGW